nr:MAG TPA: hypothetical protein [Caudoviricetes sp.]
MLKKITQNEYFMKKSVDSIQSEYYYINIRCFQNEYLN